MRSSPRRELSRIWEIARFTIPAIAPQAATTALRELFHFSYWFTRTYAKGAKPDAELQFSPDALPRLKQVEATTLGRLQEAARRYADQAKAREEMEAARAQTEAQRAELDAEKPGFAPKSPPLKPPMSRTPDAHDYNEAQTRDAFIDSLLHEAGWPLDQPRDREFRVAECRTPPARASSTTAPGDDGKLLALVEAKRTKKDARAGQQQAKLDADCLQAADGALR